MVAAFGQHDGAHELLPAERLVEAHLRLCVFELGREGLLAPGIEARIGEGCALQARRTQPSEMAAAAKPSEQPRTESCVASGNGRCEA